MTFYCRLRAVHCGLLILLGACQPADSENGDGPAVATSPVAKVEPAPATELTCSSPVKSNDTVASLRERYGDQARVETLHGPEGIEFPGLVLWPDDLA